MEFVEISLSSEVASSRLDCVSCGDSFSICAEDALQPFDWFFRTQFLYLQVLQRLCDSPAAAAPCSVVEGFFFPFPLV
jgi:hypothetical protein